MEEQPFRIRVIVAATVATAYACAFLVVAVWISVDATANHGALERQHTMPRAAGPAPLPVFWWLLLVLVVGALWLMRSAVRALRRESYLGIVIPLGILLVVGTVGETIDLLGTASGASDVVGAGILFLAAVPVALLWRPLREVQKWRAS
jgi:hypothetical protein